MATAGPMAAIAVAAVIDAGMKPACATSSPFLKIAPSFAPSFAAICPPLFNRDSVASLTRKRPCALDTASATFPTIVPALPSEPRAVESCARSNDGIKSRSMSSTPSGTSPNRTATPGVTSTRVVDGASSSSPDAA